jgi:glycosyltransferase involved in cell wall biosynthesis
VPVYNGARWMRRALDAVLAQDYENVEIIVSDNASTDESPEILREYSLRRPMRIIRQETNIGASRNFQALLAEARGEYFFWACCDDYWDPSFTRRLVAALEASPQAGVGLTAIKRQYDDGTPYDLCRFDGRLDPSTLSHWRVADNCAAGVTYHLGVYGIWRTEFLKKVFFGYPLFLGSDRLFMCGVALATRFVHIAEPLYVRTVHWASTAKRYAEEDLGVAYSHPMRFVRAVFSSFLFLMTFPAIPLRRRFLTPLIAARFSVLVMKWMAVAVGGTTGRRWLPRRAYRAVSDRLRRFLHI